MPQYAPRFLIYRSWNAADQSANRLKPACRWLGLWLFL